MKAQDAIEHGKMLGFPPDAVPDPEPDDFADYDTVNHPSHYGGADNPYEAIKVINAWGLNFNLGSAVKYVARAGKKDPRKEIEDLQKAAFYINYEIDRLIDLDVEGVLK